jgi:hypothetical protein
MSEILHKVVCVRNRVNPVLTNWVNPGSLKPRHNLNGKKRRRVCFLLSSAQVSAAWPALHLLPIVRNGLLNQHYATILKYCAKLLSQFEKHRFWFSLSGAGGTLGPLWPSLRGGFPERISFYLVGIIAPKIIFIFCERDQAIL